MEDTHRLHGGSSVPQARFRTVAPTLSRSPCSFGVSIERLGLSPAHRWWDGKQLHQQLRAHPPAPRNERQLTAAPPLRTQPA
mmetsp:Transcript_89561/g.225244  ORF Transcript_89561/g.225244 Transcript_89561/m.225244 type:complete len:82 (-) Transcript_89561:1636-1881(-)